MVMQQVATPTTIASTAIKLQLYIDGVLQTATSTPGSSQEQAKFADDVLYIGGIAGMATPTASPTIPPIFSTA